MTLKRSTRLMRDSARCWKASKGDSYHLEEAYLRWTRQKGPRAGFDARPDLPPTPAGNDADLSAQSKCDSQ